jgi:hypothetical protein
MKKKNLDLNHLRLKAAYLLICLAIPPEYPSPLPIHIRHVIRTQCLWFGNEYACSSDQNTAGSPTESLQYPVEARAEGTLATGGEDKDLFD